MFACQSAARVDSLADHMCYNPHKYGCPKENLQKPQKARRQTSRVWLCSKTENWQFKPPTLRQQASPKNCCADCSSTHSQDSKFPEPTENQIEKAQPAAPGA